MIKKHCAPVQTILMAVLLAATSSCAAENIPASDNRERLREEIAQLREAIEAMPPEAKQNPAEFELKRIYGTDYERLNESEKKYLTKNFPLIRRITQKVLDRMAHERVPADIRTNERNVVEFYLHDDGTISDLRCDITSAYPVLDEISLEVIRTAYPKYPRPLKKTLIRYKILYRLGG